MRALRIFLISLVVLLMLVLTAASFYMLDYALAPAEDRRDTELHLTQFMEDHPEARTWMDSLLQTGGLRDTFLVMPSGERHHAFFAHHPSGKGRTALVLHGWRDTPLKFLHLARIYHQDLGMNILLPDLHAHGLSEGESIGMGWKERLDVLRWMEAAAETFQCDSFVVHGVSMGAATTMNVSGEPMPEFVRDVRFVEDCGYTSVWDEFAYELKQDFSLPPFPLMYSASLVSRLRYGWSFAEASPLRQVSRCKWPMLFIHGDRDDFVPSWMVHSLYEAKPEPKQLWVTEGCGHNDSYRNYSEEYIRIVKEFVNRGTGR